METAVLGKTGLRVSRLGIGLAEIGSLSDVSAAGEILNRALDLGISFLDSAACYGSSEEWIGRAIAHRRTEYVLATKAGHVIPGYEGQEWTARTILDSIERSLRRMRTDHVDLVQLHSCGIDVLERGEAIGALQEAKRAGKTRFVGYSGDRAPALWVIGSGQFDTLQVTYNVVDQSARYEVIPKARAQGLGIIAKRPIANAAWGGPENSDPVRAWYRQRALAMSGAGPIPQSPADPILLALGFVLAEPGIDTAIVGTSNLDHLKMNVALVEYELPISEETIEELHRRFDQLERSRGA
jgi:aryl-alcohol dehydrogenase-like predicted oxidoreductase